MSFVIRDVEPEKPEDGAPNFNEAAAEGSEVPDGSTEGDTEFVAASPKKPLNQTAMMLFAILTIGAAGIYLMYSRVGPAAAKAASDPTVAAAQTTITEFMQRGSSNVSLLSQLLAKTAQIVEQFKISSLVQIPLSDLKANPFHFATAKAPTADDGSDAAKKRKELERAAIQTAVRSLQLQSLVLRANRKACMINNVLYQEGEEIDGFTVESISAEGVIVKKDAYRFRLQMANK